MNTKVTHYLIATVILQTFAVAAGALVLSYDALYTTGVTYGIPSGKAWIWPLLIDLPLIVFTLALLVAQITLQSVKLWAGLVILYTIATVAFNLSHAQPSPLGWLVAVVAPVGLLLTTEALRHLAKMMIERQAIVETLAELDAKVDTRRQELNALLNQVVAKQQELDALSVKWDNLHRQIEALKVDDKVLNNIPSKTKSDLLLDTRRAARQTRLDTLRGYLLDNPQVTLTEAAKYLDVSRQTVGEYIKKLGLRRNGNGWEVMQ